MKKSFITALLTVFTVLALFANGKGGAETSQGGKVTLNPLGQLPLVNEKVTLEVFAQQPAYIEDWRTNDFTLWYEEQTNVHLEWNLAPTESLKEKRSLLLASGDYPDFFLYAMMTPEEEITYGEQGVFIPLNDLIDENAPELQNVFSQRSYLKGAMTAPSGNIFSMPALNECYHCWHSIRAYINTDWLETLGLDMPETTEEFYQVLVAFKEKDPNGNGKADELPLMGATTGWNQNVADFFINSFIYNHGGDRFFIDKGVVKVNYDKNEYREALRWLNKLYKEGLIAPESFTQDDKQMVQIGTNPDTELIGVGIASLWWSVVGLDNIVGNDGRIRNRHYRALAPLQGPQGVQYASYFPYSQESMLQISVEAENPELIVRWADKIYTPEYTLKANRGPYEGKFWRSPKPGEVGINGKPALFANVESKTTSDLYNDRWANMGTMFRSNDYRLGQAASADDPWAQEVRLYNLSAENYAPYVPGMDSIYPPVYMKADEVGELSRMKTTINDYVNESMVRFIIGDMDIEKEWDAYLNELKAMGLDKYVVLHQRAYDRQYK